MRETIKRCLAKAMMCQLENTPSVDDLEMHVEIYGELFQANGLTDSTRIMRRFNAWCSGNSRFPTPADILQIRLTDYRPTPEMPRLDSGVKRITMQDDTQMRHVAEHLNAMRKILDG